MDQLNYWAIAERDIEIQNPITDRKLRLLDDYCDIRDGLSVLDIGCGKAWLMRQWADKFAIEGVGVDVNARFLEVARRKAPARGRLTFHNMAAKGFPAGRESYDIVLCLGAAFAIGEAPEALEWMAAATRPGGTMVLGDMVLKHAPAVPKGDILPPDTLGMIGVMERHGAEVSATISASEADFERYASHHRHATLTWARANPDHPDHAEVLKKSREDWIHYQRTIRPMLGWTILVGRKKG
ncbi:class I SAM-dependent methyltransferase [Devosia sp.]|uniref:SAM-dependent methyltransferase n=1 Tax=Devosia sp. TaxID=1871048 RepID=UPI001AC04AFC|nr:class I SAM-dependent methyltransferase [Devosia sp.]MBN9310765.1 methyltransferase domain-containing protein [Devosia sp.]